MTVDEVKNTLPLSDEGMVFMSLYNCKITPEDFILRFGGATLTHGSLYSHSNATTGWKTQFDDWKTEGILN